MRKVLLCVPLILVFFVQDGGRPETSFVLPAEWEPHEAVWVSFFGGPVDEVLYEVVRLVSQRTRVRCVVPRRSPFEGASAALPYEVRARLKAMGADLRRIEIVLVDSLVQVRDKGPIFTRNAAGELRVVDFAWNNFGELAREGRAPPDSYPFDSLMAAALGVPRVRSEVVMEGGALEVNGQGTLLQVESVAFQRNPGQSRAAIEAELKQKLGQKKVVWLKEGLAEDPNGVQLITDRHLASGVGGHVDEFARFVGPRTIVLAFPDSAEAARDPVKRLTYDRMMVNYEILRNERDQDGRPFEIIKAPVPDVPYTPLVVDTAAMPAASRVLFERFTSVQPGDILYWAPVSSYLNFFVTNGLVFVPAFWRPGLPLSLKEKDERFQAIMAAYFPGRTLVPIDPTVLNHHGGGLHCWLLQQPRGLPPGRLQGRPIELPRLKPARSSMNSGGRHRTVST